MKLRYLLDTNICIYIVKQKPIQVLKRFETLQVGEVAMSIVTYGELMFGTQKSNFMEKSIEQLEALAVLIPPLPLLIDSGKHYALIRADLEKKGNLIGNNDLWIAAHALTLDVTLITNNEKEFSRVKQLKIENWV